jgi:aspartyl-tRNA(Asn)/glutamyl-tRNA(Gln) amidotransferase subunit A
MAQQLARITAQDKALHSVVTLASDSAMAEASVADERVRKGLPLGPLHGVPFALKDIIDAQGLHTTAHSKILADNVATCDATVTTRIKSAGGILIGKLATHEFAFGGPSFDLPWPPARNPWDTTKFTGGSSSGSGAAIAAGFVPLALGSDTGGSVRNPASLCGIVGMKPTYGRVSRRGLIPLAFSLDHIGPMTRTVMDNAALLQIIAGHDPADPSTTDRPVPTYTDAALRGKSDGIRGMRIGVIRHFFERDLIAESAVVDAINRALGVFADLGAQISDVETQPIQTFADGNRIILLSEGYAIHQHWLQSRPEDYAKMTREKLLPGAFISAADYVQALRNRPRASDNINLLFEHADVLITASNMDLACAVDDAAAIARTYPRNARTPFNLTGHPALSLPIGFTESTADQAALPLALQIIGRHYDEASVYCAAAAYEQATQWSTIHPTL